MQDLHPAYQKGTCAGCTGSRPSFGEGGQGTATTFRFRAIIPTASAKKNCNSYEKANAPEISLLTRSNTYKDIADFSTGKNKCQCLSEMTNGNNVRMLNSSRPVIPVSYSSSRCTLWG